MLIHTIGEPAKWPNRAPAFERQPMVPLLRSVKSCGLLQMYWRENVSRARPDGICGNCPRLAKVFKFRLIFAILVLYHFLHTCTITGAYLTVAKIVMLDLVEKEQISCPEANC